MLVNSNNEWKPVTIFLFKQKIASVFHEKLFCRHATFNMAIYD